MSMGWKILVSRICDWALFWFYFVEKRGAQFVLILRVALSLKEQINQRSVDREKPKESRGSWWKGKRHLWQCSSPEPSISQSATTSHVQVQPGS